MSDDLTPDVPPERTGPGRPKLAAIVNRVNVLLPAQLHDEACAYAYHHRLTVSEVMRRAVANFVCKKSSR